MYRRLIPLTLAAALLVGCGTVNNNSSDKAEGMLYLEALENSQYEKKQYTAEIKTIEQKIEVSAKYTYLYDVNCYIPSSVSTLNVKKLSAQNDSYVKAGDELAVLSRAYDVVRVKELEIELSKQQKKLADEGLEYQKKIEEAKAVYAANKLDISRLEVEKLEYEYKLFTDEKQAEINNIQSLLDEYAQIESNPDIFIYAEMDGVIHYSDGIYPGKTVEEGKKLGKITDVSHGYYIAGDGSDFLHVGDELDMTGENNEKLTGTVVFNNDKTKNIKTDGAIIIVNTVNGNSEYDSSKLPANVKFKCNSVNWKNVLVIDTKAILMDENRATYVMKKVGDSVERSYVKVYVEYDNYSIIVDGLNAGDICIVEQ